MNIALVCDSVMHVNAGAFISTLRFAEILKKRGHKIIFITSRHPNTSKTGEYKRMKIYRFFSLPFPKTKKEFYLSFPRVSQIKKVLQEEDIDILHIIDQGIAAISSIKAAKSLKIPIVIHCHTQTENIVWLPLFLSAKIGKIVYWYLFQIYKNAKVVISPSEMGKRILKKNCPKLNIEIISNGVDTKRFRKVNPESFVKKYHIPKSSKRLLFVGRLQQEKSIDTIIKAMPSILKKYRNAHLIIVGSGPLEEELKELARNLNVKSNVTFSGRISDKELVKAFNACDVFVLPSLAELEGMVVLEAMACGKPLIISDTKSSAASSFVDKNGYLFKTKNPEDLALKAVKILQNTQLRSKMAKNSYNKSKKYDINKSVDKLERIYEQINP